MRKKIVPVPKAPRTVKSRYYVRKNAYAVNRLARDVRYLKMAQYGHTQKNLHVLTTDLTPTSTQPCLCVINNIQADNPESGSLGSQWYQINDAGASEIVARFERNDNSYWDQQNEDIIDTGIAFLTSIKLTFRIFCDPDAATQISNKRVRIDLFKQRTRALVTPNTLGEIQQLPSVNAQSKLFNMATPTLNKFNPEYFTLISTKWVFLNPSKVNNVNKGTGAALKYVTMDVPRKYLGRVTQQTTVPDVPGGTDTNGIGWQVRNFPIAQRIWCMLSSDDTNTFPSQDPSISITCQRYCSWRDGVGSSAL